jgi:hypothetical protein
LTVIICGKSIAAPCTRHVAVSQQPPSRMLLLLDRGDRTAAWRCSAQTRVCRVKLRGLGFTE